MQVILRGHKDYEHNYIDSSVLLRTKALVESI